MTWRRGEAGSTLIDRPKDAPVPDFTNGKERVIIEPTATHLSSQHYSIIIQFIISQIIRVTYRSTYCHQTTRTCSLSR